jgi:hypothetical protein
MSTEPNSGITNFGLLETHFKKSHVINMRHYLKSLIESLKNIIYVYYVYSIKF